MTELDVDFHSGSGQGEMVLKQDPGEEEGKEHKPTPLNANSL